MRLFVDVHKDLGAFKLDVSFETESGQITGLLGASGCGKSMTLRCVAGIEKPDRGRIVLDGRVLFDSEQHIDLPPQKRRVGYLFQNYALFPNMTIEQNIAVGVRDKKARQETVCLLYTSGGPLLRDALLPGGVQLPGGASGGLPSGGGGHAGTNPAAVIGRLLWNLYSIILTRRATPSWWT